MDSLTQIVLGAAVGEAVVGKKLGNRALLWGAIAGTIPDLDVIPGLLLSPTENLILHRGPTHGILFCLLAPILFAWLAKGFYNSGLHNKPGYKYFQVFLALSFPLVPALLLFINTSRSSWYYAIIPALILASIAAWMWHYFRKRYLFRELNVEQVSFKTWYTLFFWGFLTHSLLDCFTTYGTQLLWPFTNLRISWDVVNVVDPLYTLPFMICLFVVMAKDRHAFGRRFWNYAGISISSLYLILALIHKSYIHQKFESYLSEKQFQTERCMCTPTMFNNALWYCLAEGPDTYLQTHFSLLDPPDFEHCHSSIPKVLPPSSPLIESREWEVLRWFSDNYYSIFWDEKEQTLLFRDLRFGNFDFYCKNYENYVFEFKLRKINGAVELEQRRFSPDEADTAIFKEFVTRILGRVQPSL